MKKISVSIVLFLVLAAFGLFLFAFHHAYFSYSNYFYYSIN
ncbi:MAG: hypothetical protein WC879_12015 [Melioribacteraceae bacterium]